VLSGSACRWTGSEQNGPAEGGRFIPLGRVWPQLTSRQPWENEKRCIPCWLLSPVYLRMHEPGGQVLREREAVHAPKARAIAAGGLSAWPQRSR
jgi:hypothetical protein